jgi:lauroyl/myristoyl acyltransferase
VKLLKQIRYLAEFVAVLPLYALLKIMPIKLSSFIFGNLVRLLGRLHGANKTALKNIKLIKPEWDKTKQEKTVKDSWEKRRQNFGRIYKNH